MTKQDRLERLSRLIRSCPQHQQTLFLHLFFGYIKEGNRLTRREIEDIESFTKYFNPRLCLNCKKLTGDYDEPFCCPQCEEDYDYSANLSMPEEI